ncbi:MAG TPA: S9 family peptidase [Acidimicrobiia bacterium]|nr:S9 family peptidase [Acidimicrobiia bacterium]
MTDRLHGLATPSDPAVSPDGRRVAFGVTVVDSEADRYRRRIWIAEGSTARPFTSGDGDSVPVWSPDGQSLAFLRAEDRVAQLAIIPVDGGEARLLTDLPLGVSGVPVWAPDGRRLAVVGSDWRPEWADLDDEERARRPRRIERRDYRADGLGWTHDRLRSIYLVDAVGDAGAVRLDGSDRDQLGPVWSPDGSRIAYLTDLSDRPGYDPGSDIRVVSVEDGETVGEAPRGQWAALGFRADGVLHGLGSPGDDFPDLSGLWRLEPEVIPVVDHPRGLYSFAAGAPRLRFDGAAALVWDIDSGRAGALAVEPDGSVESLHTGLEVVSGFDRAGGTLAVATSTVDSPGHLVVRQGDTTEDHHDFGGREAEALHPRHLVVDGAGGPLDVWVHLPPGEGPVPLLLNIHGGPASHYGWGYFDEFQVYARAGYGVVATNPRGSTGGSREFLQAVRGEGWGTVDVEDIDAAVAAAMEEFPRLDRDRMGVMGGSYGGFLTAWLIAHQTRWKAAVVERALLSWPSFGGTSDIGGWFADSYLGEHRLRWERSPLRVADRVETPTLILHSENDFRCPIEQAEQFFDILAGNGVPTEFVRFPGEGHELTRSGRPRHREERFEIILEWLGRWLSPRG